MIGFIGVKDLAMTDKSNNVAAKLKKRQFERGISIVIFVFFLKHFKITYLMDTVVKTGFLFMQVHFTIVNL